MKQLILINGTMGCGKSSVASALNREVGNSVWLDGDWCWMADPFVVNDRTKKMVVDNIHHILHNFLSEPTYEHVIFSWVMDQQEIIDTIVQGLQDIPFTLHCFTLQISEAQLIKQIKQDIQAGKRRETDIERSIQRLAHYDHLATTPIVCDGKAIDEIVKEIKKSL